MRHPRLTYVNLDTTNETIINDYEEQKIWVPRYTIWKVNEDGLREDDSFQTLSATPVKEGKLFEISIHLRTFFK